MQIEIIVVDTLFLSTLSLRRATGEEQANQSEHCISIHALLAESDDANLGRHSRDNNFYPRSPCGERPVVYNIVLMPRKFLSTLSLRRATVVYNIVLMPRKFLSTLSLRRATEPATRRDNKHDIFLSTLSLRRATIDDLIS